jgi:hypothetical protein
MNNDLAAFVTYILLRLIQLGIIVVTIGIFVEAIL